MIVFLLWVFWKNFSTKQISTLRPRDVIIDQKLCVTFLISSTSVLLFCSALWIISIYCWKVSCIESILALLNVSLLIIISITTLVLYVKLQRKHNARGLSINISWAEIMRRPHSHSLMVQTIFSLNSHSKSDEQLYQIPINFIIIILQRCCFSSWSLNMFSVPPVSVPEFLCFHSLMRVNYHVQCLR